MLTRQVVPELDPATAAAANNTCMAVRTIADVDGEVRVLVLEATVPEDAKAAIKVFSGELDTPGRHVTIRTSEMEVLLEQPVSGTRTRVQVLVDHYKFPATVWVVAS